MTSDCHLARASNASRCADALVILGAKVRQDGTPSGALRRRLDCALDAFASGLAPAIVCAGGKAWGEHVEAVVMRDYLVRSGVPNDAVLVELSSHSTLANAMCVRPILARHGLRRVCLVTCPWHMRRALALFRRSGVDAHALPAAWGPAKLRDRLWRGVLERVCETRDMMRLHWESLR